MNDIEQKILDSIATTSEKFTLVHSEWGYQNADGSGCGCALSCVLVANNIPIPEDPTYKEMSSLLVPILGENVNEDWVREFTIAFDNEGTVPTEASMMGERLHEKFFPENLEEDDFYEMGEDEYY